MIVTFFMRRNQNIGRMLMIQILNHRNLLKWAVESAREKKR